jgi:cyclic pyranopterin monophosphate synthase
MNDKLSHFNEAGEAHMVDVGAKNQTERIAKAGCLVKMRRETLAAIQSGTAAKGDVIGIARLAGIMASKRTADLIPLCHPLPITSVDVSIQPDEQLPDGGVGLRICATVKTHGRTGVEMEALTAAAVAGLTVYDMCKAIDRAIVITDTKLLFKSGGKSGTFSANS